MAHLIDMIQRFSVREDTNNLLYNEGVGVGARYASTGGKLSDYPFHPNSDPFYVQGIRDGYKAFHLGEAL